MTKSALRSEKNSVHGSLSLLLSCRPSCELIKEIIVHHTFEHWPHQFSDWSYQPKLNIQMQVSPCSLLSPDLTKELPFLWLWDCEEFPAYRPWGIICNNIEIKPLVPRVTIIKGKGYENRLNDLFIYLISSTIRCRTDNRAWLQFKCVLADNPPSPGEVGHTTGIYVPYSFWRVVWVLLCPSRTR